MSAELSNTEEIIGMMPERAEEASTDSNSEPKATVNCEHLCMCDVGAHALLDKEGEVEIFKRIEDGMREMCAQLGRFPPAVGLLLELYEKHKRGEIKEEMVVCVNEEDLKPMDGSQGTLSNFAEDRISQCDIEKHLEQIKRLYKRLVSVRNSPQECSKLRRALSRLLSELDFSFFVVGELNRKLESYSDQISEIEKGTGKQDDLMRIEQGTGCSIAEIKELSRAVSCAKEMVRCAKEEVIKANQRLVISIARKYANCEVQLSDLEQEGTIGLIKAVDKFQYRLGYKFSTYATWWIRQGITYHIANHARTIRIPINQKTEIRKMDDTVRQLTSELGREPKLKEIAHCLEMSESKLHKIMNIPQRIVSLEMPAVNTNDDYLLRETIKDQNAKSPEDEIYADEQKKLTRDLLKSLPSRESSILRMLFGIDENEKTPGEIARQMNLSSERIRQIKIKALGKLRQLVPLAENPYTTYEMGQ